MSTPKPRILPVDPDCIRPVQVRTALYRCGALVTKGLAAGAVANFQSVQVGVWATQTRDTALH